MINWETSLRESTNFQDRPFTRLSPVIKIFGGRADEKARKIWLTVEWVPSKAADDLHIVAKRRLDITG